MPKTHVSHVVMIVGLVVGWCVVSFTFYLVNEYEVLPLERLLATTASQRYLVLLMLAIIKAYRALSLLVVCLASPLRLLRSRALGWTRECAQKRDTMYVVVMCRVIELLCRGWVLFCILAHLKESN